MSAPGVWGVFNSTLGGLSIEVNGTPINKPPVPPGSTGEYTYLNSSVITGLKGIYTFVGLGVTPNDGTDQSGNVNTAWNTIGSSQVGILPVGQITFSSPISPTPGMFGYSTEGQGGSGQTNGATNLVWAGGDFGTAMFLDRQRDTILGRFTLDMKHASSAVGIAITQQTNTSGGISTHNFYHNISVHNIGVSGTGIALGSTVVGDSGQNNEGHVIWRYGGDGLGIGFSSDSSNARSIALYETEMVGCSTGFSMGGGSWHIIGGLTQNHSLALSIDDSIIGFYGFMHDEGSAQGVSVGVDSIQSLILMGNQYAMNFPNLSLPYWDFTHASGATITIGNRMNANTSVTNIIKTSTVGGGWISIGDILPNQVLANLPNLFSAPNVGSIGCVVIGTANVANAEIFTVGKGLWISTHTGGSPSTPINSPPITVSALYTDGHNGVHVVPVQFVATLSDISGTSPVVWQLQPAIDPITASIYAGPINVDFGTNSNGGIVSVNQLLLQASSSPTSATTAGIKGQIAWDSNRLYVCTAGGPAGSATWKSAVLVTV